MSYKRTICLLSVLTHVSSLTAGELLSPMTVTASRTPVSVSKSGSSVTIIEQQQIKNRQLLFVTDLLRDAPGVAISQNGGAGTFTQLRLRGAEANHTLVLIDGIEANDITLGSEFDFANLITCGLERIEVLRGPQSSLWGSDALAGVVSVQSIKGAGPLHIESIFNRGSFDARQNCTGISAGNERQRFSLYGSYFENNGTNISELGPEDDSYRNTTLNFNYGVNPTDNFEINLIARHIDSSVETDDFRFNTTDFTSTLVDADMRTETVQNYLRFESKLDTFNGAFTHHAGFSLTDTDNENFIDDSKDSISKGQKLKFDSRASLTHSTNNAEYSLTFAYERERKRFESAAPVIPFFGDPSQRQKFYNTEYIGEYRTGLYDQLFVSASIRRDYNSQFENRTTHRLSASYTPHYLPTRLHASYGTGIKNPGFIELFGFITENFIGNSDLKPEKSEGWEAGITHQFSDQLEISATYFTEDLEDEINGFFDLGGGFSTAVNLEGESNRKGLELSFHASLSPGFDLTGAYTYVDSTQPEATGKTSEIRVPGNTASLIANYRFLAKKANLNLKINYVGDQFDNDFGIIPTVRDSLHDYTLVNIAGQFQVNNWMTLEGRIENLFDTDYQDIVGYETQGINAHIGIRFQNNLQLE